MQRKANLQKLICAHKSQVRETSLFIIKYGVIIEAESVLF